MSEIAKCVKTLINLKYYVTTVTAITTIRTTGRHIKLTSEAYMSISAFTRLNKYSYFI